MIKLEMIYKFFNVGLIKMSRFNLPSTDYPFSINLVSFNILIEYQNLNKSTEFQIILGTYRLLW